MKATLHIGKGLCNGLWSYSILSASSTRKIHETLQADVHDVVVVGGASRMTGLRDRLELMFPAHFQTSLHMTDATINAVSLSLRLLWTRRSNRPGTCPAVCKKIAICCTLTSLQHIPVFAAVSSPAVKDMPILMSVFAHQDKNHIIRLIFGIFVENEGRSCSHWCCNHRCQPCARSQRGPQCECNL